MKLNRADSIICLFVLFLSAIASVALGDNAKDGDPASQPWKTPFAALSPGDTDRLVLMLITDGDPLTPLVSDQQSLPSPWCASVLSRSLNRLLQQRPDLQDRMAFQHLAAGTPKILTGGKDAGLPDRAMLVILDNKYQLLAWMVGVPDSTLLVTMVEDAEEVKLMMGRFNEDPSELGDMLLSRNLERLDRVWTNALTEQWQVMSGRPDLNEEPIFDDASSQSRLLLLATIFRRVYVKDVALRFGLTEKLDRRRLAILEQHPEARRPWCVAMMPFVAGDDFPAVWRPMIESVWNRHCVSRVDDAGDLIDWWDGTPNDQPVVLSLRPPLLESSKSWPPESAESIATKRGMSWNALQELLQTESYRDVSAHELSYLMRDREIAPVNIYAPSRVRYLYFESTQSRPILIREGDIPGRHVAFVKRNRK